MRLVSCLPVFALCLLWTAATARADPAPGASEETPTVTLYDADPNHLWNRLYAVLFLRIDAKGTRFGSDDLDVLLWTETSHLLAEPSYGQAIYVLDEFIGSHGEKLVPAPAKRAFLQRDLWAAFDWAIRIDNLNSGAGGNHDVAERARQLRARLAVICQRVALSRAQIESLPDPYAASVTARTFAPAPDPANPDAPFLPPDLFDADGPWVCLGDANARTD